MAAECGDRQARAELDRDLEAGHTVQHMLRSDAGIPGWPEGAHGGSYHVRATEDRRECRFGAEQGFASCMLRWAEYLRTLDREAEADRWLRRAARGKADVPPRRDGKITSVVSPYPIVLTAAVTSAVGPFVRAMIARLEQQGYDGLRQYLLWVFGRRLPKQHREDRQDRLLVVNPPPDQQPATMLQVWTDLPDEAIEGLLRQLNDLRSAPAASDEGGGRWYWNGCARRWQVLRLPGEAADPGGDMARELPLS